MKTIAAQRDWSDGKAYPKTVAAQRGWRGENRCETTESGSGRNVSQICTWKGSQYAIPPSRIIVGEVRQAESLDLLIALNSGLPGMCTIHANSAREAVTKMCTLPLLAGDNVSSRFVVPTVASSIDIVVHAALEHDGVRRVREIAAVPGRIEGDVVEIADIFVTRDGRLERGSGFPPHEDRFRRAGYDLAALLAATDPA